MLAKVGTVVPVPGAAAPVESKLERLHAWQLPPPPPQHAQQAPALAGTGILPPSWWKEHEHLLQHG